MKIDMVFDLGENKGNLYLSEDEAKELWARLNSFFGYKYPPYYLSPTYPTYPTYPWITSKDIIPLYINTINGTWT
jgi:hypothetical protein